MTGRLIAQSALDVAQHRAMFRLLSRHFAGVDEAQFAADLAEKNWVVLLEDDAGELVGFSTLHFHPAMDGDEPISVVYSGDTIVDPSAWSSSGLSRSWIGAVRRLHREHGRGRLWWLLLTSGYRTYRFLPVFWREFFPRFDQTTPAPAKRLLDQLTFTRFGSRYDAGRGIVRFDKPQALREHLGGIPASKTADPHVEFFARANPGHAAGDELVCLTELCEANLTPAGWRMVRADTPAMDATR